jgi:hypothetical protein
MGGEFAAGHFTSAPLLHVLRLAGEPQVRRGLQEAVGQGQGRRISSPSLPISRSTCSSRRSRSSARQRSRRRTIREAAWGQEIKAPEGLVKIDPQELAHLSVAEDRRGARRRAVQDHRAVEGVGRALALLGLSGAGLHARPAMSRRRPDGHACRFAGDRAAETAAAVPRPEGSAAMSVRHSTDLRRPEHRLDPAARRARPRDHLRHDGRHQPRARRVRDARRLRVWFLRAYLGIGLIASLVLVFPSSAPSAG